MPTQCCRGWQSIHALGGRVAEKRMCRVGTAADLGFCWGLLIFGAMYDVNVFRPDGRQPALQLLGPHQTQAGGDNYEQGPLLLCQVSHTFLAVSAITPSIRSKTQEEIMHRCTSYWYVMSMPSGLSLKAILTNFFPTVVLIGVTLR